MYYKALSAAVVVPNLVSCVGFVVSDGRGAGTDH